MKEKLKKVLKYCDWLITNYNNEIPTEPWCPPTPDMHPCSIHYSDVEDIDADYQSLVNCIQRHTHCSTAYCLKRLPNGNAECCYKYPCPTQVESTLSFEKFTDGTTLHGSKR